MGLQPLCLLLVLMTFTSCSIAQTTLPTMDETSVVTVMETMILMNTWSPEPPAPENVAAVAKDTSSFIVTWDIPIEDDNISFDMNVSSTSNASDGEILLNVTSGITIDQKTPGDRYEVIVYSMLDGQSTPSTPTYIRLSPEIVEKLREIDNGIVTSYVEVEWDPPVGIIDGYEMNCSQGDPQHSSLDETGRCNNIVAGANITVTVWSVSGLKVSGTDSIIVTAYPNIVANLSSLPSTSNRVFVEWDKPYGELTQYLVNCSDGAPSVPSINDIGDENLNVYCDNVTAGSSVTVTVTTKSGTKQNPTNISVESAPGAVVDLTEDNATTDSVTVSWTLPEDHIATYQYDVKSSDNNAICITAGSNKAATCTPVTAGSLITVTVTTVSGNLNSSADIAVQAVPNEVSDVTIAERTTNSVSVSWKRPMGELDYYEITCFSGDATPEIISADEGSELSASCTDGVTAGLTVTVNITTVSGLKGGNPFFINATAKPNPAANLTEESVTTNSVTASWEDPAGDVTEYNVSCSSGDASPPTVTASDDVTSYKASCVNLNVSGGDYTITVTSISEGVAGDGVSIPITAQPNAPQLVEDSSTVDSVSVRWPYPGGDVDYYLVDCEEGTPENDTITAIEGELKTATCNVETPGDNYTIYVTSVSNGQLSSQSSQSVIAKPEAVESVNATNPTVMSMIVSWIDNETCARGDCVWDNYLVRYNGLIIVTDNDETTVDKAVKETNIYPKLPGNKYEISVIVQSGTQRSTERTIMQRLEPEAVESVNATNPTVMSMIVSWIDNETCARGDCVWDNYLVRYDGLIIVTDNDETTVGKAVKETNIYPKIPGNKYEISVIVQSGTQRSTERTIMQRLEPEAVESVNATNPTVMSMIVSWIDNETCARGDCVWDNYLVRYDGLIIVTDNDETTVDKAVKETNIYPKIPGNKYKISVIVQSGTQRSTERTIVQGLVPESVKTLSVEDYNSENVTLIWEIKDNCANEGCVWSGYTVTYNRSEGNDSGEYMSGKNDTSIDIPSLIPGSMYDFIIYVVSDNEQSSEEPASQRLKPASVTSAVPYPYRNSITITWDEPRGIVTAYQTSLRDNIGEISIDKQMTTPQVEFVGLIAYRNYSVTICSKSYEEECENILELNIETLPDMPSAPQDLVLTNESITTVRVAFKTPALPNGIISEYKISYNGKRGQLMNDDNFKTVPAEDDGVYSVLIKALLPGYQYNFTVVAVNQGGDGEAATATITLGQKEPPPPSSTESPVANEPGTALKSFTVEFSSTVFSHCNGEISNYTVIVVESGAYDSETDEPISGIGSPPPTKTFNEVSNQKPLGEYQAFEPRSYPYPWSIEDCQAGSSRRRRQTTTGHVIKIGDGNSSGGYTNGELHSNRKYRVKFRIMNEAGYADSIYSDEIETELNPAAWLVPLLFGLFLIILILIILIILKERREPGSIRKRMPWSNGGIENPGFVVEDKPMRRTGDKRPVKLANFGYHLEEMEKDSDYLFSEEYNDLRPVGKNQADDTAKLDCNKSKNRFSNILPYDHTRVKLSPAEDEPGSDYINANYMVGYRSSREYIACQGPLQNTEEDMWRMVWEQGASLIVMVTQLMEGNKIKCHQYWCQEGEGPVRYGDIILKNVATEQNDLWVVRKFSLTKGPISREVLHFNFTAWPDHGVPDSPDHLIKFVQAVRRVKKTDGKPHVVHCSAGVGRTGTFIALDTLMSYMESGDEVDIFGLIRSMRMNRCLMVQTEIQYVYIHQCIMALLEGDDENMYENYNGTTDPYYNEALI